MATFLFVILSPQRLFWMCVPHFTWLQQTNKKIPHICNVVVDVVVVVGFYVRHCMGSVSIKIHVSTMY